MCLGWARGRMRGDAKLSGLDMCPMRIKVGQKNPVVRNMARRGQMRLVRTGDAHYRTARLRVSRLDFEPAQMTRQLIAHTQRETARLLGYGDDVDAMNRDHDDLHRRLCDLFAIPSYSMQIAAGQVLPFREKSLADIEEDAVLCVQRLLRAHGVL